jgi:hypothetical protein
MEALLVPFVAGIVGGGALLAVLGRGAPVGEAAGPSCETQAKRNEAAANAGIGITPLPAEGSPAAAASARAGVDTPAGSELDLRRRRMARALLGTDDPAAVQSIIRTARARAAADPLAGEGPSTGKRVRVSLDVCFLLLVLTAIAVVMLTDYGVDFLAEVERWFPREVGLLKSMLTKRLLR